MKKLIKDLKIELKAHAAEITRLKATRKSVPNGYVYQLGIEQHMFRVKHVIRCLLRGRTMLEIENYRKDHLVDPNNNSEICLRWEIKKIWKAKTGLDFVDYDTIRVTSQEYFNEQALCANQ